MPNERWKDDRKDRRIREQKGGPDAGGVMIRVAAGDDGA